MRAKITALFSLLLFFCLAPTVGAESGNEANPDTYHLDTYRSYMHTQSESLFWGDGVQLNINAITNLFFECNKLISETIAYIVRQLLTLDPIERLIQPFAQIGLSLWNSLYSSFGLTLFIFTIVGIFFSATFGQARRALRQAGLCFLLIGIIYTWKTVGGDYLESVNKLTTEVQIQMLKMVSHATEAKSEQEIVRSYYFDLTIQDPFLLMNYGTVDKQAIDEQKPNRTTSLLRKEITKETWEEIDQYIAEHEEENLWLSPHKVGMKFCFGLLSIFLSVLLGIPLLMIGALQFFIQLFALILFAFLPIAFLVSFIPKYQGAMFHALKHLLALFGCKILVSLLFLLFCYLITAVKFLIPAKDVYSYLLQILMISAVMIVIFKKRDMIISGMTGGMITKVTPEVISQGVQEVKGMRGVAAKGKQKPKKQTGQGEEKPYIEDETIHTVESTVKHMPDKTVIYKEKETIRNIRRTPQVQPKKKWYAIKTPKRTPQQGENQKSTGEKTPPKQEQKAGKPVQTKSAEPPNRSRTPQQREEQIPVEATMTPNEEQRAGKRVQTKSAEPPNRSRTPKQREEQTAVEATMTPNEGDRAGTPVQTRSTEPTNRSRTPQQREEQTAVEATMTPNEEQRAGKRVQTKSAEPPNRSRTPQQREEQTAVEATMTPNEEQKVGKQVQTKSAEPPNRSRTPQQREEQIPVEATMTPNEGHRAGKPVQTRSAEPTNRSRTPQQREEQSLVSNRMKREQDQLVGNETKAEQIKNQRRKLFVDMHQAPVPPSSLQRVSSKSIESKQRETDEA